LQRLHKREYNFIGTNENPARLSILWYRLSYNQGAWHVTSNGGADESKCDQRSNSSAKRLREELSNQADPSDCSLSRRRWNRFLRAASRTENVRARWPANRDREQAGRGNQSRRRFRRQSTTGRLHHAAPRCRNLCRQSQPLQEATIRPG